MSLEESNDIWGTIHLFNKLLLGIYYAILLQVLGAWKGAKLSKTKKKKQNKTKNKNESGVCP